ncbi:MAG: chorismate mutase, partial [Oscillospiraceae bacterium]|nr:chorismate mutase [Oscillospiraceae bacterium]
MDITQAREEIAAVDREMAALFRRRMEAARAVAEFKRERGLPVADPAQEERVLARGTAWLDDDALTPYYLQYQQSVMEVSKRWQHYLLQGARIAYSGVEGAFAHIAARRIFPDGTAVSYPSFEDAYKALLAGDCDSAVLPLENSFAGEVGQVSDLMFRGDLAVNAVYELQVVQNLLGTPDAALEGVRTVVSHPQALAQCRSYLRSRGLEEINAANTAVAARSVAEKADPAVAAIASAETAALYGLKVLDHDINESKGNTTRFAVFSRTQHRPAPGEKDQAFLLLFTVNHVAGALAKAINVIGEHGFNMKVLRSRPMKTLAWKYY